MRVFSIKYFKKSFLIFLSLLILSSFLSPVFAKNSSLYNEARDSYYSLTKSEKKKKLRHNWENTIDKFLKVIDNKGDSKVPDAAFMAGELYRMLYTYSSMKKDLTNSIIYYEMVPANHSSSSLADDSIYKIGEIYEIKLKDFKRAYEYYLRLTKAFPDGDMVSKARSKLVRLKKYAPKFGAKKNGASENRILVDDIKYWSEKDSTRVVIYPKKSIDYKYSFLDENKKKDKPQRLYIDLYNTKLNRSINRLVKLQDGLLTAIRSDQHDNEIVRVVLDIERIDSYRIFTFENPFRIVIDVSGEREAGEAVAAKKKPVKAPKTGITKKNKKQKEPVDTTKKSKMKSDDKTNLTLAKQLGLGVKKIVIDPGHGGKDPGAVGVNKIREKDITLTISKKLKEIIEKNLNCQVILTRDKDTTLSLEARTAIAKKVKADIFVSVHTNASERSNVRGFETYYLNYATNEHAMRTAARENATSKLALSDLEGIVKIIRYSNVQESRELAHKVQNALGKTLPKSYKGAKSLGVKQAPFYVLFGSKKPSILIETSFIDHKVEGKLLQDDKYLTALARSIFNGINAYIDGFEMAAKN